MAKKEPEFGVFEWRGDGKYHVDDALKTFVRKGPAQKWAEENHELFVVVRELKYCRGGKL